ncbi:hypothetical protein [Spirosoma agri]|uniref:Uncharacterized protein n=1 Tax=Spirosoma agri TaxID=1987381 RepID=A0A6M0IBI2_9BACT|nr:hypothetical protein [Spirosoma agri]NEU65474.1 hypothetical protein [Spirosoma agri]
MKKIAAIITFLVLGGQLSGQAQSGSVSKGQRGAAPVNYAEKANTSQTQGNGVPYSKDKEQRQSRADAKSGSPTTPRSSVGNGSSTGGQGGTSPSKKSGAKMSRQSSGSGTNQ